MQCSQEWSHCLYCNSQQTVDSRTSDPSQRFDFRWHEKPKMCKLWIGLQSWIYLVNGHGFSGLDTFAPSMSLEHFSWQNPNPLHADLFLALCCLIFKLIYWPFFQQFLCYTQLSGSSVSYFNQYPFPIWQILEVGSWLWKQHELIDLSPLPSQDSWLFSNNCLPLPHTHTVC